MVSEHNSFIKLTFVSPMIAWSGLLVLIKNEILALELVVILLWWHSAWQWHFQFDAMYMQIFVDAYCKIFIPLDKQP